jgi:hypothetical protein
MSSSCSHQPSIPAGHWPQVSLPAGQVAKALERVAAEPLVFVGHPAMVVAVAAGGEAAAGSGSGDQQANQALEHANQRMRDSGCRALTVRELGMQRLWCVGRAGARGGSQCATQQPWRTESEVLPCWSSLYLG